MNKRRRFNHPNSPAHSLKHLIITAIEIRELALWHKQHLLRAKSNSLRFPQKKPNINLTENILNAPLHLTGSSFPEIPVAVGGDCQNPVTKWININILQWIFAWQSLLKTFNISVGHRFCWLPQYPHCFFFASSTQLSSVQQTSGIL